MRDRKKGGGVVLWFLLWLGREGSIGGGLILGYNNKRFVGYYSRGSSSSSSSNN